MRWFSFGWQDPLGRSTLVRRWGFRLRIGWWTLEVWHSYPNKKVIRD